MDELVNGGGGGESFAQDDINDQSAIEDGADAGIISRLTKQAGRRIKTTSLQVHSTLALTINLLALCSSSPFNLLPRETYVLYFLVSVYSTYRFFYNFRSYEIFDFEDLYVELSVSFQTKESVRDKKFSDPYRHYFSIIQLMAEKFPGVHFEFKLKKRV